MNILFLSMSTFDTAKQPGIYTDLLRSFVKSGYCVYTMTFDNAKKIHKPVTYNDKYNERYIVIYKVPTSNGKKEKNLIKKGIKLFSSFHLYKRYCKKFFANIRFDLIIYSTPPISFLNAIYFIKKRDHASTYLLLKDIFPQNAVDIGIMKKNGIKGLLYHYFRKKEKQLYSISDRIGCMSQANVDYVIKHNPEIDPSIVEICPNSIEVQDMRLSGEKKFAMRERYGIPTDKKVFIYGGNLGKPQGIPFIIDCLRAEKDNKEAFFLIVGDGTEYGKLEAFVNEGKPANMKLMKRLPKEDYDRMIAACDVGMIFLDHRFTIPNFPSRLLSYMQAGLPILACTDTSTDVGTVVENGGFGWSCTSDDVEGFKKAINNALISDCSSMGNIAFDYLTKNYSADDAAKVILKSPISLTTNAN